MNEYKLEQYCNAHSNCDGRCMMCPAFASYQRWELGYDDEDDEEEFI